MNTLRKISADEFDDFEPIYQVITDENARCYAVLALSNGKEIAVSWHSDLLSPVLCNGENGEIWIGVDGRAVAISADGKLVFSIGLNGSLESILSKNGATTIKSDIETVAVNKDYSIRELSHSDDLTGQE